MKLYSLSILLILTFPAYAQELQSESGIGVYFEARDDDGEVNRQGSSFFQGLTFTYDLEKKGPILSTGLGFSRRSDEGYYSSNLNEQAGWSTHGLVWTHLSIGEEIGKRKVALNIRAGFIHGWLVSIDDWRPESRQYQRTFNGIRGNLGLRYSINERVKLLFNYAFLRSSSLKSFSSSNYPAPGNELVKVFPNDRWFCLCIGWNLSGPEKRQKDGK